MAIVGAIQLFWVEQEKRKTATVRSLVPGLVIPEPRDRMNEIVHIVVTEGDI